MTTQTPDDFRVLVKIQNGHLWAAIQRCGFNTVAAFARDCGLSVHIIHDLLAMRISPLTSNGVTWRKAVLKLCEYTGDIPEDLFPDTIPVIQQNNAEFFTNVEDVAEIVRLRLDSKNVARLLTEGLTDRQKLVLAMRTTGASQSEVARALGVTHSYIGQVEAKALRRARWKAGRLHLTGEDVIDDHT